MSNLSPRKPKRTGRSKSNFGATLSFVGILIAVFPIALAYGTNTAAYGWVAIATFPVGGAIACVGLVSMIIGITQTFRTPTPPASEDLTQRTKVLKDKSISLAILVPILLLTLPLISFVAGSMIVGAYAGIITVFAFAGVVVVAAWLSLKLAIDSNVKSLQITIALVMAILLVGLFFEAQAMYLHFIMQSKIGTQS
jgi:MFS family permease